MTWSSSRSRPSLKGGTKQGQDKALIRGTTTFGKGLSLCYTVKLHDKNCVILELALPKGWQRDARTATGQTELGVYTEKAQMVVRKH